jgi:septal ring factor EnvC (AmiA/AmiB activator)
MLMAPLQGQLRSGEAAWATARTALEQRTASLEAALQQLDSRCKTLDTERTALVDERSELNNELRRLRREVEEKETKTADNFWQRTVAATREANRLQEVRIYPLLEYTHPNTAYILVQLSMQCVSRLQKIFVS